MHRSLISLGWVIVFGEEIRLALFRSLNCCQAPSLPAFGGHVIDVRPYGGKEGMFRTFPTNKHHCRCDTHHDGITVEFKALAKACRKYARSQIFYVWGFSRDRR